MQYDTGIKIVTVEPKELILLVNRSMSVYIIRSRSLLKCEEGEWSRRRECQLIWWPNVYSQAKYWTFATEILSRTHCTRKLTHS